MRIAIYGNEYQEAHLEGLTQLFATLSKYNAWVEMEKSFYDYLCKVMPVAPRVNDVISDDNFSAAIAFSIGGDGTFLRTAQWVAHKGIPILGINTGHLGYLADACLDEMEHVVKELFEGNYKIECRTVLEVSSDCDSVKLEHPYALNEVAVLRQDTSSMISMHTLVNGEELTTYMGDGLIISTPTGSTAYNMSVGGPILDPTSCSWVLSPVSPHSLTMRPLVLRDDSRIKVTTTSRVPLYRISLDGRSVSLPIGTSIYVKKAPFGVKVIQRTDHNFSDTLRNKLMWGMDKR